MVQRALGGALLFLKKQASDPLGKADDSFSPLPRYLQLPTQHRPPSLAKAHQVEI